MGDFRQLAAYSTAVALADDLRRAMLSWPSEDRWTAGVQMIRAADSIGANIAEGHGRFGLADERRFLLIARGSAFELQHWIETAVRRELLPEGVYGERAAEAARMLNGLIKARRHSS